MPPRRSCGAGCCDGAQVTSDSDAQAAHVLVARDYLGFAWADENLIATERDGGLAEGVTLGQSICLSVPALFGMDAEIRALAAGGDPIEIPNVAMLDARGEAHPLNYVVTWDGESGRFLLAISRPIAIDELSVELQRETRRRILAEAELVEQAAAIEQANVALRQANEDLHAFTRIISHDLKAPMRAMRYFTEDLEAALSEPGAADPKAHLDRLKAQSQRMSSMITGLLAYSRLDRVDPGGSAADSRRLVEDITASLPRPEGISLHVCGEWPAIRAFPELFDLVVRNLVENAIKHHDRTEGRIELAATTDKDRNLVTVLISDDGAGIAKHHQQAVFDPFSKLFPENNLDGIGIGLTLVQRAANNAGAELLLHSDPDLHRGTTFELRWPIENKTD